MLGRELGADRERLHRSEQRLADLAPSARACVELASYTLLEILDAIKTEAERQDEWLAADEAYERFKASCLYGTGAPASGVSTYWARFLNGLEPGDLRAYAGAMDVLNSIKRDFPIHEWDEIRGLARAAKYCLSSHMTVDPCPGCDGRMPPGHAHQGSECLQ